MKLISKWPHVFSQLSVYFSTIIRIILNALLVVICFALIVGVIKAGVDIAYNLRKPLETLLQNILLDTIFVVALVEISITILGYLKDGMVHVRYIVDTILIIMLNEVVSAYFHDADFNKMTALAIIIATLAAVRISVIRFSPRQD
ncbi:MAG: conserved rane protein of unknown function [Candidatus Saccharibacteria bacterium]|nr:conserved rane protein of unknown function [Candidatus Saccharibacteria bacterium]